MASIILPFEVWIAYHTDYSDAVIFEKEIDALRYAVDNSMKVKKVSNGQSIVTGFFHGLIDKED